jgi:hypothetical protein
MPTVEVISTKDSFYRAGKKFTKEPRVLKVVTKPEKEDEITAKDLEALKAEPMLFVREVADKKDDKKDDKKGGKK